VAAHRADSIATTRGAINYLFRGRTARACCNLVNLGVHRPESVDEPVGVAGESRLGAGGSGSAGLFVRPESWKRR